MNPDEGYRAWLNGRRGESPPADLTNQIMSAVREATLPNRAARSADSARQSAWQRVAPSLVFSAAALVLAARLFSIVSLFVIPSPIADVAMIEPAKEKSHEP